MARGGICRGRPAGNSKYGVGVGERVNSARAGHFEIGGVNRVHGKGKKKERNRAGSRVTFSNPFKTQRFAKNAFKTTSFR